MQEPQRSTPSAPAPILTTDLPIGRRVARGKVRDIYELGQDLLLVATDRLSAFDVVMNEPIPGKGMVLTALSRFWLDLLRPVVQNHMLSVDVDSWRDVDQKSREVLRFRAMRCRKARPLPVEWVVRGYLTGSGFKDYKKSGMVSGVALPAGLEHAARIEPPILTPSTKAASGHDEPISFDQAAALVGPAVAARARDAALRLYTTARDYAATRGIVIADTKFEFGLLGSEVILIDEVLTPDSSRFWPAAEVRPGGQPTSFDKQLVRDWLETTGWNKTPPPPRLPDEIVRRTAQTYREICVKLTGRSPEDVLRG
jgi:phosphoribosylaminoimidazole-succinocarboxamide synthase